MTSRNENNIKLNAEILNTVLRNFFLFLQNESRKELVFTVEMSLES